MEKEQINSQQETDKAIPKKKLGIFPRVPGMSWLALLLLWLVFAVNSNCRELLNRVMPAIISEYHISASMNGIFIAILTLSNGLLALWGSAWSDRVGQGWARKKSNIVIAICYVSFTILCGIPALTMSIVPFIIFGIFRQSTAGVGESVEVTSVAEWWPAERRGFALGIHHTGYPWGSLLGGFLISAIMVATGNNWRICFIVIPLIAIPIWICYWIFAKPKRFKRYEERALEMGLTPTIDSKTIDTKVEHKGTIKECLKNPNIVVGSFCALFGIASLTGVSVWLSPYLAFVAKYDFSKVAVFSVIFTITGGIGQIFWGTMADKFGRKRVLLIAFAWLAVGYFMMQFVGLSLGWLVGAQLFLGCCTNALFPVLYSLVSDSARKTDLATANSMTVFFSGFGGAIASLAIGFFINMFGGWNVKTGYMFSLYFLVALMIIAFFVVLLFAHETIGKRRGRDWALSSYKSCGIKDAKD
jgi:MFS family permease